MKEMAIKNAILNIKTGSTLYGTNTPESDVDYLGIFIPNKEFVLGLKGIKEVDISVQIKNDARKNTKESIDKKFYSISNFIKLAMDNNPNILEMLFVDTKNIVVVNNYGKTLLDFSHLFVHKGLYHKFKGYAKSQKHKMMIKRDNFNELESVYSYLKNYDTKDDIIMQLQLDQIRCHPILKFSGKFLVVGDINIQTNITVYRAIKQIERRLETFSNRKELITTHGYDTKFAMHLVRLMLEAKELLFTGRIEFPLKERDLLLDIRKGKYKLEEILFISDDLELECDSLYNTTLLQPKADYDSINMMLINMYEEFYYNGRFIK